jgi:hypothetical protein
LQRGHSFRSTSFRKTLWSAHGAICSGLLGLLCLLVGRSRLLSVVLRLYAPWV